MSCSILAIRSPSSPTPAMKHSSTIRRSKASRVQVARSECPHLRLLRATPRPPHLNTARSPPLGRSCSPSAQLLRCAERVRSTPPTAAPRRSRESSAEDENMTDGIDPFATATEMLAALRARRVFSVELLELHQARLDSHIEILRGIRTDDDGSQS